MQILVQRLDYKLGLGMNWHKRRNGKFFRGDQSIVLRPVRRTEMTRTLPREHTNKGTTLLEFIHYLLKRE